MSIEELIKEAHSTATSKGWWDKAECPCITAYKQALKDCDMPEEGEPVEAIKHCVVCQGTGKVPARTFGDQIALMHSELSEALEEYRNGKGFKEIYHERTRAIDPKPEGIAVEFADVLIRIFDTCGKYSIPLAKALELKLAYNATRPHRHGGKKL